MYNEQELMGARSTKWRESDTVHYEMNMKICGEDLRSIDWQRKVKPRAGKEEVGMYRLSIRYLVSAGYLTIRYYPDPVK